MLIVLGGLPATGKSTVAGLLAAELGWVHLRVDTIEQAMRRGGIDDVGPAGYHVGCSLVGDLLRQGHGVIAESVNPLRVTRDAWREAADRAGSACVEVELCCSDADEHRGRAEGRETDIPGLVLPTWRAILGREYEPWHRDRVIVDTAGRSAGDGVAAILSAAGLG